MHFSADKASLYCSLIRIGHIFCRSCNLAVICRYFVLPKRHIHASPLGALLVVASCVAAPHRQSAMLEWTSPDKNVVLVQSTFDLRERGESRPDWNDAARMRALAHLKIIGAEARFTLIVTNPNIEEIESLYGPCLGVDAISYAWQSHACADLVRERYRADYALFLSSQINDDMPALGMPSSSSLSLIDLRTGEMVWSHKSVDADWRDDRSARTAIENLLADAPL